MQVVEIGRGDPSLPLMYSGNFANAFRSRAAARHRPPAASSARPVRRLNLYPSVCHYFFVTYPLNSPITYFHDLTFFQFHLLVWTTLFVPESGSKRLPTKSLWVFGDVRLIIVRTLYRPRSEFKKVYEIKPWNIIILCNIGAFSDSQTWWAAFLLFIKCSCGHNVTSFLW